MQYQDLLAKFKGGSTIALYEQMFVECAENGFPESEHFTANQNLSFAFGKIVGMVATALYPERQDFGFIEHDLAWQDNARSPHVWGKSLTRPKLVEGVFLLDESDQQRFAAICGENPQGELDGPTFLAGLFARAKKK